MGFTSTITNIITNVAGKLAGTKAYIIKATDPSSPLEVQFNPSEYKITDSVDYHEETRRGDSEPVVSYQGTATSTLNVKLYFDCDEEKSIASLAGNIMSLLNEPPADAAQMMNNPLLKKVDQIVQLTRIDGDEHMPPVVGFVWGSLQFIGYMNSATTTYTMFDKAGRPLRATVDIVMKGSNAALDQRKSPLMSPDRTKARIMTEDTNIWAIAQKEYGDVREWRRIADANGIMNPLDIPVGKVLKVPSIND